MITLTKQDLKQSEFPSVESKKLSPEQARTIAEIIYNLLENDMKQVEMEIA